MRMNENQLVPSALLVPVIVAKLQPYACHLAQLVKVF